MAISDQFFFEGSSTCWFATTPFFRQRHVCVLRTVPIYFILKRKSEKQDTLHNTLSIDHKITEPSEHFPLQKYPHFVWDLSKESPSLKELQPESSCSNAAMWFVMSHDWTVIWKVYFNIQKSTFVCVQHLPQHRWWLNLHIQEPKQKKKIHKEYIDSHSENTTVKTKLC